MLDITHMICMLTQQNPLKYGFCATECNISDQACENQPCEHKKIADFYRLCSIITYELFVQTQ